MDPAVLLPASALVASAGWLYSGDWEKYSLATIGIFKRLERSDGTGECIDCGSHTDEGELRRWYKEWVAFGVPIYSSESGTHVYCEDHATFDWLHSTDAGDGDWLTDIAIRFIELTASLFIFLFDDWDKESFEVEHDYEQEPFDDAVNVTASVFDLMSVAFLVMLAALVMIPLKRSR
jgi:hypothetical protein